MKRKQIIILSVLVFFIIVVGGIYFLYQKALADPCSILNRGSVMGSAGPIFYIDNQKNIVIGEVGTQMCSPNQYFWAGEKGSSWQESEPIQINNDNYSQIKEAEFNLQIEKYKKTCSDCINIQSRILN